MKLKGHGRKPKTKKVVPAGGEASTSSSNVIPLETTHEPSKISEAAPPPIALKPAATISSATPTVIPNIAAAGRLLAPPKWAETKYVFCRCCYLSKLTSNIKANIIDYKAGANRL